MVRVCLINEPDRLLHEEFLHQLVMQKGVVNVDFLQTPVIGKSQREHQSNGDRLDHMSKCLSIVHLKSLIEPFDDQPHFKSLHRAIKVLFNLKYPLAANQIRTKGFWNQPSGTMCD